MKVRKHLIKESNRFKKILSNKLDRMATTRLDKILTTTTDQDRKLGEEITKYQKLYKAEVASNIGLQSKINSHSLNLNKGMVQF